MKLRILTRIGAGFVILTTLGGCMMTDAEVASREAYYNDKPAHITCTGYASGVMVDTDTTGKVSFEEGGRISFVDAKTGGFVTTEGECVVRYAR